MRILLATDKFKGSLTAAEVAEALRRGLLRARPELEVTSIPVADGGEGTLDLAFACGYELIPVAASGPSGRTVDTSYARRGDTAIVELADICGMKRLPHGRLLPLEASSRGVGEVIAAAVGAGCRRVILGVGGSASTDGGAGMLQGLGALLLDGEGAPVADGGAGLEHVVTVDLAPVECRLEDVELVVAADVDNPLTGPNGAAAVYGPQKGAKPEHVQLLDRSLRRWAQVAEYATTRRLRDTPGAGAAGGVGFGAMLARGTLAPGAELLLGMVDLGEQLQRADLVIVGEGSLDDQTLRGKAPVAVARAARAAGRTVIAVCGRNALSDARLAEAGIEDVFALSDLESDLDRSMATAAGLLERVGAQIARRT
jgi:glycerate 2-kinase